MDISERLEGGFAMVSLSPLSSLRPGHGHSKNHDFWLVSYVANMVFFVFQGIAGCSLRVFFAGTEGA